MNTVQYTVWYSNPVWLERWRPYLQCCPPSYSAVHVLYCTIQNHWSPCWHVIMKHMCSTVRRAQYSTLLDVAQLIIQYSTCIRRSIMTVIKERTHPPINAISLSNTLLPDLKARQEIWARWGLMASFCLHASSRMALSKKIIEKKGNNGHPTKGWSRNGVLLPVLASFAIN